MINEIGKRRREAEERNGGEERSGREEPLLLAVQNVPI
jgi:hypothetical protein